MLVYPCDACGDFHLEDYFSLNVCWVRELIWNLNSCVSLSVLSLIPWPVSEIPGEDVAWGFLGDGGFPFLLGGGKCHPSPKYERWQRPSCALLLTRGRSLYWTCLAQGGGGQRSKAPDASTSTSRPLVDSWSCLALFSVVSQCRPHRHPALLFCSLMSVLVIFSFLLETHPSWIFFRNFYNFWSIEVPSFIF